MQYMTFNRYFNVDDFKADVFDILLEDEVINNLPISIVQGTNMSAGTFNAADWLLSTVTDESNKVVLVAICTKPYEMLLYKPFGVNTKESLQLLASELMRNSFEPPGVFAPVNLADEFAVAYTNATGKSIITDTHKKLILMKLEKLADYVVANGAFRMLTQDDITFVPSWENAFYIDCNLSSQVVSKDETWARIKTRIGKDLHYIWEDKEPVSQAVYGRETPTGGVISWVYTPPQFRGLGYATSVVAEVSKSILSRGKQFCCLFADAANPASCAVYRKLGYKDILVFNQFRFS